MKVGDTFDYCGMAAIVVRVWSDHSVDVVCCDTYNKVWVEFFSICPPITQVKTD